MKVNISPNSNFNSLAGDVHAGGSEEYNEYRRCWTEYPSKFILRDFPLHLDIEITSRCNLKCSFCDKLSLMKKGQFGDMDIQLFKKIIDEGAANKLCGIKLSYRGEPLLHKNIIEMIRYAKSKGVLDVYFNTNGMLLTPEMNEKLIDAGLDRISVSVDGNDPALFEQQRKGASYNVILKNIENLIEIRNGKKADNPRVRVQTVLFENMDLAEYRKFWLSRCDEVAAIDFKDSSKRENGLVAKWACPQLWQRMTIEWDGTIFACNNDDMRELSPGSVKEKSVHECWHDVKIQAVRRLHQSGLSHEVKDCDGCCWRTAQIKKILL